MKICFYQKSRLRSNYHRERSGKLTLRAIALSQSDLRNCGLLFVFMRVWNIFAIGGNMVT